MNQGEWIAIFEEINGGKPSPLEFLEGLKNSEFNVGESNRDENQFLEKIMGDQKRRQKLTQKEWLFIFKKIHDRNPTPSEFNGGLTKGEFFVSEVHSTNLAEATPITEVEKVLPTQKEWVSIFEETNGRSPSPSEFNEGLAQGEFIINDKSILEQYVANFESRFPEVMKLMKWIIQKKMYLLLISIAILIFGVNRVQHHQMIKESRERIEEGTWLLMERVDESHADDVVYLSGTWEELFEDIYNIGDNSGDNEWKYGTLKHFEKIIDEELPTSKITQAIEEFENVEMINPSNLIVAYNNYAHIVISWQTPDRATFVIPSDDGNYYIFVAQKINLSHNLSGEYGSKIVYDLSSEETMYDDYFGEASLDFDESYLYSKKGRSVGMLSFTDFISLYELVGGDTGDIKNLVEINEVAKQVGYSVSGLEQADVFILSTEGTSVQDVFDGGRTLPVAFFAIPTNDMKKVIVTPTDSQSWLKKRSNNLDSRSEAIVSRALKMVTIFGEGDPVKMEDSNSNSNNTEGYSQDFLKMLQGVL